MKSGQSSNRGPNSISCYPSPIHYRVGPVRQSYSYTEIEILLLQLNSFISNSQHYFFKMILRIYFIIVSYLLIVMKELKRGILALQIQIDPSYKINNTHIFLFNVCSYAVINNQRMYHRFTFSVMGAKLTGIQEVAKIAMIKNLVKAFGDYKK